MTRDHVHGEQEAYMCIGMYQALLNYFARSVLQLLHEKILKIKDADRCACVIIGNKKVRARLPWQHMQANSTTCSAWGGFVGYGLFFPLSSRAFRGFKHNSCGFDWTVLVYTNLRFRLLRRKGFCPGDAQYV